jgi:hypothetical protein
MLINEQLRRALKYGHTRHEWHASYLNPSLKQAKRNAWNYLRYYAGKIPKVKFYKTDLLCKLPNGALFGLFGGNNPENMRGTYFDDLVIDEAKDLSGTFYTLVILPALLDRDGWQLFSGTPGGEGNLLADMRDEAARSPDEWVAFMFRASRTGYLPERALERARKSMSEAESC